MKAWYFADAYRKLRYGDNRKIVIGETHTVECEPILQERGLHASKNILDALNYAPGPIIYRVDLSGVIVEGTDKCVATKRTYLSGGIDISDVLIRFARMCALDVIHLWDAPDIVVHYLKTGDESARSEAWSAVRSASSASAWDAAWDAVRDAVRDEASASAWYAAWSEAWFEARKEMKKKYSNRLERMVREAIKEPGDDLS